MDRCDVKMNVYAVVEKRQNIRRIAGGKAVRMIRLLDCYSPILLSLLFICQIFYENIDINVS